MTETKPRNAEDMAKVLGDMSSRVILEAVHRRARTAQEISQDYGIPIAVCFRRIKALEGMALLQRDSQIFTQRGKRRWTYISNVHSVDLMFNEGNLKVSYMLRNGYCSESREVLP